MHDYRFKIIRKQIVITATIIKTGNFYAANEIGTAQYLLSKVKMSFHWDKEIRRQASGTRQSTA